MVPAVRNCQGLAGVRVHDGGRPWFPPDPRAGFRVLEIPHGPGWRSFPVAWMTGSGHPAGFPVFPGLPMPSAKQRSEELGRNAAAGPIASPKTSPSSWPSMPMMERSCGTQGGSWRSCRDRRKSCLKRGKSPRGSC
ncbi:hypothetical protein SAMN04487915_110184 [Arthrobacter sp. ov118]|nr:hypothetical protein SAMN04487915_110184 [Arthrobacter sp. ov118]